MKNSEPAFPCTFYDRDSTGEYQPREQLSGMTLRDYFAAKAMQSMVIIEYNNMNSNVDYNRLSKHSYEISDAMLLEREKNDNKIQS